MTRQTTFRVYNVMAMEQPPGWWLKFLEAAGRVICALLWSMYVDDGNLVDLAKAEGSGQTLIGVLFAELGTPPKASKQSVLVHVPQDST